MRLLLDENISPALVGRLAEVGIYAQSVPMLAWQDVQIVRFGSMRSITTLHSLR